MTVLAAILFLAVLGVTLYASISDLRYLRIPNWCSLAVIAAFVGAYLLSPTGFSSLPQHLGVMVFMFFVSYGMFALGMMGGGDSKFATALSLWLGVKGLMPFLFYMALMGGILGLLAIFFKKKNIFKNQSLGAWIAEINSGKSVVPYGVAISFGFWMTFLHTGFLSQQLNEVFKIIH